MNKTFKIKNYLFNSWPTKNANSCGKLCTAYDFFAFNGDESEAKKIDCICFSQYGTSII